MLYELNSRFNLNIDPQTAIANDAYLGVHLRTSTDAVGVSAIPVNTRLNIETNTVSVFS